MSSIKDKKPHLIPQRAAEAGLNPPNLLLAMPSPHDNGRLPLKARRW